MTSVCPFAATSRVSYYQQKLLGKKLGYNKPEIAHRFLWENTGIKRVLQNEFYCGTLVCHRSYTSKINHIHRTIETDVKSWLAKKNTSEKRIKNLTDRLAQRKSDQEQILLERIRDREQADIYTGMLEKCEAEIKSLTAEIEAIRDYDITIRKRKAEMKSSIDILDGIIKDGAVSDNNLRLLVDNIVIHESDGKLSINIDLKAAFSSHLDIYDEDGALTAKAFAAN